MVNEEQKIRLIHEYRTDLLDRMFDELSRNAPGCSTGHITGEIVAVAMRIRAAMAKADEITCSSRGLFVLGLQQIVDSFMPVCSPTKPSNGWRKNEIASARWCVKGPSGSHPSGTTV